MASLEDFKKNLSLLRTRLYVGAGINKFHVFRGKKRESFRTLSSVVGPENIDGNIVNTYADSNSFKDCMSNLLDNFITLIYLIR
jgi:hypothetical protein